MPILNRNSQKVFQETQQIWTRFFLAYSAARVPAYLWPIFSFRKFPNRLVADLVAVMLKIFHHQTHV